MSPTIFPNGAMILVCDGFKALLFENAGDGLALDLKLLDIKLEPHSATREMGSDRPTRVYDRMDGSRSGAAQVDWHDRAEAEFLGTVANMLEQFVVDRKARHVSIIAPPTALGILRAAIGAATHAALMVELSKDLVKHPVPEIERQLLAFRLAT